MIVRKPCQCPERREAIMRIHKAFLRGDLEAMRREMHLIKQTAMEDILGYRIKGQPGEDENDSLSHR